MACRLHQASSDFHDFFLFGITSRIHQFDVFVHQLLDLFLTLLGLIFRDFLALLQLLDGIVAVTTDITDSHLGLLGLLVDRLDKVLATLLRQRRD